MLTKFTSFLIVIIVYPSTRGEAQQGVSVHLRGLFTSVDDVHVGFHLIFSLECHVALQLALLVRTEEVRLSEVPLEGFVLRVIDVFVILAAKMACQVFPAEVVIEFKVIVIEFFAEVTPGMWQYFCSSLVSRVSMFDVGPQCFQMVDSLLSYKHSPSFEANSAECFLMI